MFATMKVLTAALAVVVLMGSERLYAGVQDQVLPTSTQKAKGVQTAKKQSMQSITSPQTKVKAPQTATKSTSVQDQVLPTKQTPTKQMAAKQLPAKQMAAKQMTQKGKQAVTAKKPAQPIRTQGLQGVRTQQPQVKKEISNSIEELPQE